MSDLLPPPPPPSMKQRNIDRKKEKQNCVNDEKKWFDYIWSIWMNEDCLVVDEFLCLETHTNQNCVRETVLWCVDFETFIYLPMEQWYKCNDSQRKKLYKLSAFSFCQVYFFFHFLFVYLVFSHWSAKA